MFLITAYAIMKMNLRTVWKMLCDNVLVFYFYYK